MNTRVLIVSTIAMLALGGWALASPEASKPVGDAAAACAAMMHGQGVTDGLHGRHDGSGHDGRRDDGPLRCQ